MGQEAGQMERLSGAEVKLSKKISCVLRHKPELAGLTMDKHGWVSVSELIKALPTDIETLEKIVALNNKKSMSAEDIDTDAIIRSGYRFCPAENGVWLTNVVSSLCTVMQESPYI